MKFDVWKYIVSQSSYFKSRLDPVTLRRIEGGGPKISEDAILQNSWNTWISRYLTNGWSDLNETWYIEKSYVSDAPFSIRIGSGNIEGWRGETEILETGNLGKPLEWRDRDETWWGTSCRYEIDIIGTDLFSLRELGVVNLEKLRYF